MFKIGSKVKTISYGEEIKRTGMSFISKMFEEGTIATVLDYKLDPSGISIIIVDIIPNWWVYAVRFDRANNNEEFE